MCWACFPKLSGNRHWRHLHICPPVCFIAVPMQLLMVLPAERHGKLVAYLSAQGSRPRNLEMVSVTRSRFANKARLRCDKGEVRLAAPASDGRAFVSSRRRLLFCFQLENETLSFRAGTSSLEQTKSTSALDLIAKQKRCQAVQECARQDEKHALRHAEILLCQSVLSSRHMHHA